MPARLRHQHAQPRPGGGARFRPGTGPGNARGLRHGVAERGRADADPGPPAAPGPAIPASGSQLAAHLARPVTVQGAGGGGRWRVVITAVHYQPQRMLYVYGPDDLRYVISGRTGPGSSGMLIVMTPLAGTGPVAAGCAAAAGTVLVLLAAAAFALTRAILRPLREAAGLAGKAGQGAGDRLEEVMARLSALANRDHRRCSMTLARMRERLHASCAAEAAARWSAADMSGQLGETCLQPRRPVSILHGFTEYCRSQDRPPPARLAPMLQRAPTKLPGWKRLQKDCTCVQPVNPPDRIAAPIRPRLPAADALGQPQTVGQC